MKPLRLYLIGENLFYPLSDGYLVYLCKKEDYDKLSEEEAFDLIVKTLQGVKAGLNRGPAKPEIVH